MYWDAQTLMAGFGRQLAVSLYTCVLLLLTFCKPLSTFQDTDVKGILSIYSYMQQTNHTMMLTIKAHATQQQQVRYWGMQHDIQQESSPTESCKQARRASVRQCMPLSLGGTSKKDICESVHTFEPGGEVLLGQGV